MNKLLLLLFLPIVALTSCNDDKVEASANRYSSHTFSVAGGLALFTQITDHHSDKMYLYELNEKKGLILKETIDLTKCGSENIPFETKSESNSAPTE